MSREYIPIWVSCPTSYGSEEMEMLLNGNNNKAVRGWVSAKCGDEQFKREIQELVDELKSKRDKNNVKGETNR